MLIPFSNIKKKHTYKSEKTWRNFLLIPFLNIKKAYLQILKNLGHFFAYPFFQILKKEYLQISKYPFHTNNNFKGNNLHITPLYKQFL